jgi:RPC5 protein
MQTHAWENVESMSDDERETVKETPVEQIQMKRRETDSNQSARTQSYAHLQSEEDKEQWHRLQVLPAGNSPLHDRRMIFLPLSDAYIWLTFPIRRIARIGRDF